MTERIAVQPRSRRFRPAPTDRLAGIAEPETGDPSPMTEGCSDG